MGGDAEDGGDARGALEAGRGLKNSINEERRRCGEGGLPLAGFDGSAMTIRRRTNEVTEAHRRSGRLLCEVTMTGLGGVGECKQREKWLSVIDGLRVAAPGCVTH